MEIEIYQRAQEIHTINKQLQYANQNLAKLDQLKTDFFANISHELRTPLMLILGPVENLLADRLMSPEHNASLLLIKDNAKLLLKHVNDLLDIAKLEAGKMSLQYVNVDLVKLINRITALFEAHLKERQLGFYVDTPAQMYVEIDPDKIQRVLINLLSNAIKFTPVKTAVKLSLSQNNNYLRLIVEDRGAGVALHARESIFERFYQDENAGITNSTGTGLGLAIAREFVELHGGHISVDKAADEEGASFTVELPIKAPAGTAVQPMLADMHAAMHTRNLVEYSLYKGMGNADEYVQTQSEPERDNPLVLVVEDNIAMNEFICDSLASSYRVINAFDGEEGLQKALDYHPQLIVTDIMMPNMSGVELVHAVRECSDLLTTPIIILTAKADDRLCVRMLGEGAQDYMIKPFSLSEFKARIANLLLMKKAEDELERFVYLASHDLKSPLPSMSHLITWIEEDLSDQMSEQSKKHLNLLRQRTCRMSNLLDGLLKYAQAGQANTENSETDVKQLVVDIVKHLNPPATFTIKYGENLPVFTTSKDLEYVFCALIDNSIKHHHRVDGHIEIGMNEAKDFYEFFVKDDGPGIEPKYYSRIFQLFQTLQPRDTLESSGVGLSIAKKIVESHGGKILVDSVKNKGTRFQFSWHKLPKEYLYGNKK